MAKDPITTPTAAREPYPFPKRPLAKNEERMLHAVSQGRVKHHRHDMPVKGNERFINSLRNLEMKFKFIVWDDKNARYVLTDPAKYKTPAWITESEKAATKKK